MTPYYQDDLVTLYNADSLARPELWRGGVRSSAILRTE